MATRMGSSLESLQNMFFSIDLPEYHGKSDEDAVSWLNEYEKRTRFWPAELKLEQVKYSFEQTPKYWFEDVIEPTIKSTDWDSFKKAFLKKFINEEKIEIAETKLRDMAYTIGVTKVSSFFIDYEHWMRIANPKMEEGQKVRDLINRFPASFKSRLAVSRKLNEIETLKDLESLAERVEQSLSLESEGPSEMTSFHSVESDQLSQIIQKVDRLAKDVDMLKRKRQRKCRVCHEDWPGCKCKKVCRTCSGQWPQCGCKYRRAEKEQVVEINSENSI